MWDLARFGVGYDRIAGDKPGLVMYKQDNDIKVWLNSSSNKKKKCSSSLQVLRAAQCRLR